MAVSHCLQSQFPEMEPPSYSDFPSVRQLCLAPDLCKFLAHLFHSFLEGMGASGFDNFHRCEMIHWDQPVSSRWLVWPRMDTGYRLHTTSHILQHQSAEQNNHEMTDLQWAALYPSVIPQTISPPRLSGITLSIATLSCIGANIICDLHGAKPVRVTGELWRGCTKIITKIQSDSIIFDQIRLVAVFSFFESSHQSNWFRKSLTARWAPQLGSTHWTKVCILSSVMSDRLVMHLASSDGILCSSVRLLRCFECV